MTAWWKVLGSPELTPDVRRKLIAGLHAEVATRTVADLEAERDEILLGLLGLRARYEKPAVTAQGCSCRLNCRTHGESAS